MDIVFFFSLLLRYAPCDDAMKNKALSYFIRPGMTRQQVEAIFVGPGCDLGGVANPEGYPYVYKGVWVIYRWPNRKDASFRVLEVHRLTSPLLTRTWH